MKIQNLLIILIIIIILITSLTILLGTDQTNPEYEINETIIGSNSNGTVYKTICGNINSNETAVIILGVHNLENGTHDATNQTIYELTNNKNLTKKYVVYYIKINYDAEGINTTDYQTNRHMGELLAYNYVVNDIKQYNPYIVVDVHEMEVYYANDRYVVSMSNNSVSQIYANQIANDTNLPLSNDTTGTSPKWVTFPIANQGFNTVLIEYAQAESYKNKLDICYKLIKSIDNLNPK